jgi:pimeloyl-ACP methyl ester carboxylesterase
VAKIYFFGVSDRPLLGSLHQAKRLRARSAAVLLCNPMGEEALLAHRLYRVLAEQLEQSGYTVLRFDYGGTGDSHGGAEAIGISAWLADVETAAQELGRAAPGTRLALVGVRLGATLAALASARLALRPRHLVLWDPIVDGLSYLRALGESHRDFMSAELSHAGWTDGRSIDVNGVPSEAMGMALTPELVDEIRGIDLTRERPNADHITVLSTQNFEGTDRLREALANRPGHRWLDVKGSENWNCDAALNAATVPADIIREVIGTIQTVNP